MGMGQGWVAMGEAGSLRGFHPTFHRCAIRRPWAASWRRWAATPSWWHRCRREARRPARLIVGVLSHVSPEAGGHRLASQSIETRLGPKGVDGVGKRYNTRKAKAGYRRRRLHVPDERRCSCVRFKRNDILGTIAPMAMQNATGSKIQRL